MNTQEPWSRLLRTSAAVWLALTLVCGVVYPALVTAIARALAPDAAAGSLLRAGGVVVGATSVGQYFDDPGLFWGRPSVTAPTPCDAAAGAASNAAPNHPALRERTRARVEALRRSVEGTESAGRPVPADLVTASASGLDPHISPEAARWQAPRVARAREIAVTHLEQLIDTHTEGRLLGVFGEPRVHVLRLNLALRTAAGAAPAAQGVAPTR